MTNRFIVLLLLAQSSLAFSDTAPSLKQRVATSLSDYGVPLAAETGFEALKWATRQTICQDGVIGFGCWFLSNAVDLQRNNIQIGLSRHLQESVSSGTQYAYNRFFAPTLPALTIEASERMEAFRHATHKAHSIESTKARINSGQMRPFMNGLFGLAREQPADAARILAYGIILIAEYFPDYDGTEIEIGSNGQFLGTTENREALEREIKFQLASKGHGDRALLARIDTVLSHWSQTGLTRREDQPVQGAMDESSHHKHAAVGLGVASLFYNIFPQSSARIVPFVRPSLNSLSQNAAEASTRVVATDFATHLRRSVQRLGQSEEPRFTKSESYQELRQHQLNVAKTWSELGLKMRANLFRYLALLIPTLAEVKRQLERGDTEGAASVLASEFAYIRRYDPEYMPDDQTLRMTAYALWGSTSFLESKGACDLDGQDFRGSFFEAASEYDPGCAKDATVWAYYEQLLDALLNPLTGEGQEHTIDTSVQFPLGSVGLSLVVENLSATIRALITLAPSTVAQTFLREEYGKIGDSVIRATAEQGKDDIQQYLTDKFATAERTTTEQRLISACVEMSGRTGMDAQMARAINERLQPTLMHLFDAARDAFDADDLEGAARLIAYAALFLEQYYPEAATHDEMLATLAKARFTDLVEADNAAFKAFLKKDLGHCLSCSDRLKAFGLDIREGTAQGTNDNSWGDFIVAQMKTCGYYTGLGAALLLPGIVALKAPRDMNIVARAATNVAVSSVFLGVAKPYLDSIKSQAQIFSQYLWITHRVDEAENHGRAQAFFSRRQREVPQFLSPHAQEGRREVLLVAQNMAQDFRNAKRALERGDKDFATLQIQSLKAYLSTHFSESASYLAPLWADMFEAFFGSVDPWAQQIVEPGNDKEAHKGVYEGIQKAD